MHWESLKVLVVAARTASRDFAVGIGIWDRPIGWRRGRHAHGAWWQVAARGAIWGTWPALQIGNSGPFHGANILSNFKNKILCMSSSKIGCESGHRAVFDVYYVG